MAVSSNNFRGCQVLKRLEIFDCLMVSRSGINKLEVSRCQFVGVVITKTLPTHLVYCIKERFACEFISPSLSHPHSKTVLMFGCMPSSLPTLPLPPQLHSGDASSVTAVLYYDDVTITSCSLNLILFLTIYSNTVASSYHHHVACWGQSLYRMLVILCSIFFQFLSSGLTHQLIIIIIT